MHGLFSKVDRCTGARPHTPTSLWASIVSPSSLVLNSSGKAMGQNLGSPLQSSAHRQDCEEGCYGPLLDEPEMRRAFLCLTWFEITAQFHANTLALMTFMILHYIKDTISYGSPPRSPKELCIADAPMHLDWLWTTHLL